MKIRKMKYTISLLLLCPLFLMAAKGPESNDKKKDDQTPSLAAGCSPASSIIFLEFNNVRTRVEAGGIWWQDRANSIPDYEVPVGSNKFALYAGGLWLAGTDVNGQLKAATTLFGRGVDYWAGPLYTDGTAEIDAATCDQFDRFFQIRRAEVQQFVAYQQAVDEGREAIDFPNYQIPNSILNWPGNGDVGRDQAFRLAPYQNVGGDISYEPELGDYPFFDLEGNVDCRAPRPDRSQSSRRPLFGDITYWWIFNDKGNVHTESNAPSIGMEIHGQAFAFATNDEINDMTFYNFELINRSTFTLTDTYFASYVDPDLGYPFDDYVGCDVERGLGYCYNGEEFDQDFQGRSGYGNTPAAIGIDFFEGPYQDADGIDNEVGVGPNEALNGLGYGDGIEDNERFGMRRFVYYNNSTANNGDPQLAVHYYNYMRGIWKNGQRMRHGGNGFNSAAVEDIPTDFMFPGESDPLHWGTTDANGITTVPENTNWTENNPGAGETQNAPNDRRFIQSAGPFTLEPGNVNDITVGVVFAQAESGGRLASVDKLFQADDKAQALFDNCFQVLNGPDAPEITVQEMDRQLLFYLSNSELSNNREEIGEPYTEFDPDIVTPQSVRDSLGRGYDSLYRFQGYQVFQLAGPDVSIEEIEDPSKARLVFQADIKDDVVDLVNYTFDEDLEANIPVKKVTANNTGIQRSFAITQDLFASGDNQLINFKTYYFIAIAYGYNEYKEYAQDVPPDPANPLAAASDGQLVPYLSSRRGADGGSIQVVRAIPHDPFFEESGTINNSFFGQEIGITRMQGTGNGGRALRLEQESADRLLEEKAWEDDSIEVGEFTYEVGSGPFSLKVVDPLNVIDGTFYMQFIDNAEDGNGDAMVTDTTKWKIWLDGGGPNDTVYSDRTIEIESEQLLFNPNWGLSVTIGDGDLPGRPNRSNNGFISASIDFASPNQQDEWLGGVPDSDLENPYNWILSGTFGESQVSSNFEDREDASYLDPNEEYESILGGIMAPYTLTRLQDPASVSNNTIANGVSNSNLDRNRSSLDKLNSVALFITSDKTKWTRCPVVETADGNGWGRVKVENLSVDKDGNPVDTTGLGLPISVVPDSLASSNEEDAGFVSATGMGWFPGYAINKETGERLNMVFGEDSRYGVNNGNDMIWNPNSIFEEGANPSFVNRIWGGKHYTYIFREISDSEQGFPPSPVFRNPQYDNGEVLRGLLGRANNGQRGFGWSACSWVMLPMLNEGTELLSTDVRIDVNVTRPFAFKDSELDDEFDNEGLPVYRFNTSGLSVRKQQRSALSDRLKDINVVPNPYRAISEYEETQIDNTVKFTNLPEECTIKIYNMNGTLIRTYRKASPVTFLDWNLKNQVNVPIASGVYIIHVDVPGVGEKILKWFGVMRPVDLNNF